MSGINMFGIFQRNDSDRIEHHPSGVDKIDEIDPRRKRRRRKYDFSNILDEVSAGNRPWEF